MPLVSSIEVTIKKLCGLKEILFVYIELRKFTRYVNFYSNLFFCTFPKLYSKVPIIRTGAITRTVLIFLGTLQL